MGIDIDRSGRWANARVAVACVVSAVVPGWAVSQPRVGTNGDFHPDTDAVQPESADSAKLAELAELAEPPPAPQTPPPAPDNANAPLPRDTKPAAAKLGVSARRSADLAGRSERNVYVRRRRPSYRLV